METLKGDERWIIFHGTLGGCHDEGEAHQHVACVTVGPVPSHLAGAIANTPPPPMPIEGASKMTLAGIFDHEPTDAEADQLHVDQLFGGQGCIE